MPASTQVVTDRYGYQRKESRWYPGANIETFAEAIKRRGLKDPKRLVKPRLSTAKTPRDYPAPASLQHQILIEAQGPLFTLNEDGEFSSPGLTEFYVAEFCRLNKIRQ